MATDEKKVNGGDDGLQAVESTFGRTEQYIENNSKKIGIVVAGIVILILAWWGYKNLYKAPNEAKASAQMFQAENYFQRDSFNLALNGDGNYPGFLKIIDNFGSTKAGNNAHYYAGVCYMKLKEFDKAIAQLKDFNTDDAMLNPISKGLLGDAWMEKGDVAKAESFYKDAVNAAKNNNFVAPLYLMKLATAYETQQKWEDALNAYSNIKSEYPSSNEGHSIEKYIEAMKIKTGK